MNSSGGVETKQKQNSKTSVHQPCLPLPAPEVWWRVRAQASPLGLSVARTSQGQGPQPGRRWGAAAGTKHFKH